MATIGSLDPPGVQEIALRDALRSALLFMRCPLIMHRALPDARCPAGAPASLCDAPAAARSRRSVPEMRPRRATSSAIPPHGDQAVYDALVTGQISPSHPLIDGGNFGISMDNPAAMRHRGAPDRSGPPSDRGTTRTRSISARPRRFRGGAGGAAGRLSQSACQRLPGIAVGMATAIPPHNAPSCAMRHCT